jgi:hypothetical protein
MSAETFTHKSKGCRAALITTVTLAAAVVTAPQAGAVSASVRFACASDYLANCSSYAPDSQETRRCMRAVGYRLSKRCIDALVAGGEVSQSEVSRRAASRR